jgi:hypothetical protein
MSPDFDSEGNMDTGRDKKDKELMVMTAREWKVYMNSLLAPGMQDMSASSIARSSPHKDLMRTDLSLMN